MSFAIFRIGVNP